ncbi:hypothetical protein HDV05_000213 [Chytridiales sp. JEL 0842]|nr:hypothetical protein HDV05_000213 [Chytridiales sp. JEL 0842]
MSSDPTPPVIYLRQLTTSNTQPLLKTSTGNPTTDLREASHVHLDPSNPSAPPVPVDAPSGYKEYTVQTLLFFLQNRNLEQAAYLQASLSYWSGSGLDVGSVSLIDRRDLLEYLTGASEGSVWVKGPAPGAAKGKDVGGAMQVDESGKRPADDSIESEDAKRLRIAMEEDFVKIKPILANERTLVNVDNVFSVNITKTFTVALKYSSEILRPAKSSSTSRPSATNPSSSSKKPISLPSKPSSSSKSKPTSSSSSSNSKPRIPIIIVPAALQSTITLHNALSFLRDCKFIPTEDYIKKGDAKPSTLMLERKAIAAPSTSSSASAGGAAGVGAGGGPKLFQLMDSVDKLRSEDWERVVAVFATGQEWQFKNWKYGAPVNIFNKVKGYCLKFSEDPTNEKIKAWNVTILQIHKTRRHLDTPAVNQFWDSLDVWMRANKPKMYA